jgi:hypothetical protein
MQRDVEAVAFNDIHFLPMLDLMTYIAYPCSIPNEGVDILSNEASSVLHEEISSPNVSDECRVLILCRMLSVYLDECAKGEAAWNNAVDVKTSYKLLVDLATAGFRSAKTVESHVSACSIAAKENLLDNLWRKIAVAIAVMLSPTPNGSKFLTIMHPGDLESIVGAVSMNAPSRHAAELCAVLSSGASKCLELAHLSVDNDTEELEQHKETSLSLFSACFSGVCQLDPQYKRLPEISEKVLSASLGVAYGATDSNFDDVNVQACLSICKAMEDADGTESIVIAVFTQLCQLVGAEDPRLRQAVGAVLGNVDVGRILEDTRTQCEQAERRATAAESTILELTRELEKLSKEKAALEGQRAVF